MKRLLRKRKWSHVIFDTLNYLLFFLLAIAFVVPFLHIVMYSISDISHYSSAGLFLWPRGFDIEIYKALLLEGMRIPRAMAMSLFVTIVGTFLSLMISSMFAYAIAKTV